MNDERVTRLSQAEFARIEAELEQPPKILPGLARMLRDEAAGRIEFIEPAWDAHTEWQYARSCDSCVAEVHECAGGECPCGCSCNYVSGIQQDEGGTRTQIPTPKPSAGNVERLAGNLGEGERGL